MKNSFFILRINTFLFYSFTVFFLGFNCLTINAQDCPKNIDFETGTFDEWTCYVGFLLEEGTKNSGAGWDGRVKAVPQSSQVVVWIAEGVGWDNKVYVRKGVSVILR